MGLPKVFKFWLSIEKKLNQNEAIIFTFSTLAQAKQKKMNESNLSYWRQNLDGKPDPAAYHHTENFKAFLLTWMFFWANQKVL